MAESRPSSAVSGEPPAHPIPIAASDIDSARARYRCSMISPLDYPHEQSAGHRLAPEIPAISPLFLRPPAPARGRAGHLVNEPFTSPGPGQGVAGSFTP